MARRRAGHFVDGEAGHVELILPFADYVHQIIAGRDERGVQAGKLPVEGTACRNKVRRTLPSRVTAEICDRGQVPLLSLPFVPVRQLTVCHLAPASMSSAGIDRISGTCRRR